jgi:hypothetical protein
MSNENKALNKAEYIVLTCAPATTACAALSAACATLRVSAETASSLHCAHACWVAGERLPLLLLVLMLRCGKHAAAAAVLAKGGSILLLLGAAVGGCWVFPAVVMLL